MDLIKLNGYAVPADYITGYNVQYKKVYGAEEELENGRTFTEQIRSKIPIIALECKNLTADIVENIVEAVDNGQFEVEYFSGKMIKEQMRLASAPTVTLTSNTDAMRFALKLDLEG